MRRTTVILAVVCCLAVGGIGAASVGVTGAHDGAAFQQEIIDPDDVLITVDVRPDGDAVWSIEYRTRLETAEDEQAFEELQADLEANPGNYTDRFRERMEATVDESAAATGRNMSVSDVSVSAERRELPREYGVVTYEFRWAGFGAVDGDRIRAGDAIDGLFLDEETSLIVTWPEAYRLSDVSPEPTETRDNSVVWIGPIDFTGGAPRATVESSAGGAAFPNGVVFVIAGATVFLLTLVGALVAYYYRKRGRSPPIPVDQLGLEFETGADAFPDGTDDGSSGAAAVGGAAEADAEGDDENGGDDADDAGDDEGQAPVDEELLSNEEQVVRLIERNGGRMKQKQVAEELDWTDAKTSQVTTGLRDEGKLEGFRLGRENVLSLPDEDDEPE